MTFSFNIKRITPEYTDTGAFQFGIKSITPINNKSIKEYDLMGVLSTTNSTGNIAAEPQPIPAYIANGSTIASPSGSYQYFVVSGLPDLNTLDNWELKFRVNGYNCSQFAIQLGVSTKPGYTTHTTCLELSHTNGLRLPDTTIGKPSPSPIGTTHTNYWVSLKFEHEKGYTLTTEVSGEAVEYFYDNKAKPNKTAGNYCIYFAKMQLFARSITFKSW